MADDHRSGYTRRGFLTMGLTVASGSSTALLLSRDAAAASKAAPLKLETYNGGIDPFPIPWLERRQS